MADHTYFNPRSRVGNDAIAGLCGNVQQISIHVPAWGTTGYLALAFQANYISIHAPAWGTTVQGWRCGSMDGNFNPRSRVGNDAVISNPLLKGVLISIHVPAWGTTPYIDYHDLRHVISIHVPAWGTTQQGKALNVNHSISIHVPAWGTTNTYFGGL